MNFHTLDAAPINPNDAVFHQSRMTPFFAFLFGLALTAGAIYAAIHYHSWFFGIIALFCALFPLAFGSIFRHSLHSQNWLLRINPNGLLIKFRSFLNEKFPADRPVVLELAPGEIEWAGLTRERRIFPDTDRGITSDRLITLDLKLRRADLTPLETLLREERQLKVSSRWGDEPVRVLPGGIIRVILLSSSTVITPSPKKLVATLAEQMGLILRAEEKHTIDLASDPGEAREREDKILQLAETGRTMEAIKLARNFYGYSLAEAMRFVEELTGKKSVMNEE